MVCPSATAVGPPEHTWWISKWRHCHCCFVIWRHSSEAQTNRHWLPNVTDLAKITRLVNNKTNLCSGWHFVCSPCLGTSGRAHFYSYNSLSNNNVSTDNLMDCQESQTNSGLKQISLTTLLATISTIGYLLCKCYKLCKSNKRLRVLTKK